jgi:arylsulfatase A-like enzyme
VIDLYEADVEKNFSRAAIGRNGTNNMFGFTSHATATIHAHAAENVRRRQAEISTEPERPLFLYAALHNTHAPFQVPARFQDMYNHSFKPQNVWSGMVSAVDETVKNITVALKEASMWENTLLVFATVRPFRSLLLHR